jgi:hypothetical protein
MVENNGTVYVSASDYYGGSGVWKRQFTDLFGTISGIKNLNQRTFSVYPNPVSNELILDNIPNKSVISVFSTEGKLLKVINPTDQHIEILVSDLPAGVYLLKINDSICKFIKL